MGLEGRVALVTGAGGDGVGRAIALARARDGADVALNWHRKREDAEHTTHAASATSASISTARRPIANTPAGIAEIAAFLCSEAAARITGRVIPVPGAKAV